MTTLHNRIAGQSVERLAALSDGIFAVAIKRRIVIAQALYAFGVVLCVVNTYWSIAFIRGGATLLRHRAAYPRRSRS